MAEPEPVVMCWSGGKDSAMALAEVLADPSLRVAALLTTITDEYDRISMHGVRRELLQRQADALGLPVEEVRIDPACTDERYEASMRDVLMRHYAQGVRRVVFGDLFLQDIREYRERQLANVGMTAIFPLWGKDTRKLSHACVDRGYGATLVCIDTAQLDDHFCGREFDWPLLADLPAHVDPCGERGEFHTFVHDAPIFRHPIPVVTGERVRRDRFLFCDLLPAPATTAPSISTKP